MVKKLAVVAMPALVAVMLGLASPASAQTGCANATTPGAVAVACPTFAYAVTPGAAAFTPPPTAITGPIVFPFGGLNTTSAPSTQSVPQVNNFGGFRINNDGGAARSLAPLAGVGLGLALVYATLMRTVRRRVAVAAA